LYVDLGGEAHQPNADAGDWGCGNCDICLQRLAAGMSAPTETTLARETKANEAAAAAAVAAAAVERESDTPVWKSRERTRDARQRRKEEALERRRALASARRAV
jgi:hypothetical protein